MTPRCYGFFAVPLKDCLDLNGQPVSRIDPWKNITIKPRRSNSDCTDEDRIDDEDGWKSGSPWEKWRPSPSEPLICILVLEKMGNFFISSPGRYVGDEEDGLDVEDLNDMRDLSSIGLMHGDLRHNNIVRAINDAICPRHGRAYRWRIIDFDIALKICVSPETPKDLKYVMPAQVDVIGSVYFWGWL
ncbi:hypothetical protein BDN70DRAFT_936853 [Pholiota conissans]|uniref:Protein kinase domain-containing protein n=1 Tax=Pholiota conissans TaxID=109636 RepID=A0A9P5YQT9_9AGAR|nr:hypothetical protein BDN70DRAFT_936853 [Pholiota conissans]